MFFNFSATVAQSKTLLAFIGRDCVSKQEIHDNARCSVDVGRVFEPTLRALMNIATKNETKESHDHVFVALRKICVRKEYRKPVLG